jgi:hypothetical protein
MILSGKLMRIAPVRAIVLALIALGVSARAAEPDHIARAMRMVMSYQKALVDITNGLDALKALQRLRPAAATLATLNSTSVQNTLLSRFHPMGSDGAELSASEEMKASDRFLQQLSAIAVTADSLDRCVVAIVDSAPEFVFLPLGNVMLAERFLPARTVGALLLAADLAGRAKTLAPAEIDDLRAALRDAALFGSIESDLGVRCDQTVTNYQDIRLRDDVDPKFIITLDSVTAHRPIKLLPN